VRIKRDFQIYKKTHRSGNVGFLVSLGQVNGKRKFRSFNTLEEAQSFRATCLEKEALRNPVALSDMSELGRASVRLAIEKLKPFDADIGQAVDFYLKHAKPPKGKITIQEAIELFEQKKKDENLSAKYIKTAPRCFFVPFKNAFQNSLINEVTSEEVHRYIHKRENWNVTSKNTHNRHLRALYAFLIQQGYATHNPFNSVPFAKQKENPVAKKIISAANVKALLQYSLEHNYKAECASMALIFFAGVRVDEVSRLTWENIHLDGSKSFVDIGGAAAKTNHRRVNTIPPNAVHWLRLCCTDGSVAPANYEKRMQRLRQKAKINYPQNSARHCFASYHIAFNRDAAQTAFMLGHPNPALLYRTYRELVSFEEAERFWDILPDSVLRQLADQDRERRFLEKRKLLERDKAEKEEAEMESNVGKAIKGEDGHWHPVIDDNVDFYARCEM
jgi:site-specific recombinase XerD